MKGWILIDPDGDGWTLFDTREEAIALANKVIGECQRDCCMESANRMIIARATHVVIGDALAAVITN